MKYTFLAILAFLILASAVRYLTLPDSDSAVPTLYWVTDSNPARQEQVRLFHHWLRKNGHVVRDAQGNPTWDKNGSLQTICELRIDTANTDQTKRIIQGVSGVAGDIIDIGSSAALIYYNDIGLIQDVTEEAKRLGYDPSHTFPSIVSEITRDGRQYSFPCNVAFGMIMANVDTFEKYGQPLPPETWTIDEFERRGKEFVAAANSPDQRLRTFFLNGVNLLCVYRSRGLSNFNETLTASTLNDGRFVQALELAYRWTYEDRLLPSNADRQSMTTASGYGGVDLQQFNSGIYAMVNNGRHALIQIREFNKTRQLRHQPPMKIKVIGLPYYQFPNIVASTRAAMVYAGSKYKDLAFLFQAYLASEDYNMQIVRDADSLPPDPKYCLTRQYNTPADYPEEAGLHEPFYQVSEIAIGEDHSPYVVPATTLRIVSKAIETFMNQRRTASEAAQDAAHYLNDEIARTLKENPDKRREYDQLTELQKKINQRRANGQPIPLSWIRNPFHRRYYQVMGWIEPEPAVAH